MAFLGMFQRRIDDAVPVDGITADFLNGYSIEVMPRIANDVDGLVEVLPASTRIYVAHIEGTPHREVAAAARLFRDKGFAVMTHVPARAIKDRAMLGDVLRMYRQEADVSEALVIAGAGKPVGEFESSVQLLQTGLFETCGFSRLHVAGHPEGNPLCEPAGSSRVSDEAILWKQNYSQASAAKMAIVTQFAFDAAPVNAWARRLRSMGVTMPIHVGIAGPTKISALIKYAAACGVGPSLKILQSRAADVTKLLVPYEATDVISALGVSRADAADSLIEQVHLFAFGGVRRTAEWANLKVRRNGPSEALERNVSTAT